MQATISKSVFVLQNEHHLFLWPPMWTAALMALHCLQAVVDCGALESLVTCLEEFDPGVKEAASWTLGYVASHSPELAQQVKHMTFSSTVCAI